jgi:hypothetical protein
MAMELSIQERQLLADFRKLSQHAQQELMLLLATLKREEPHNPSDQSSSPENQCPLAKPPEKRPETVNEPIFTE